MKQQEEEEDVIILEVKVSKKINSNVHP